MISGDLVAKSAPDGYTILHTSSSHASLPVISKSLPYDPVKDFAPIALVGRVPFVLIVNKDDGTGEAQAFAANAGIPVLAAIPAHEDIRRKSASYEIIGKPDGEWGPLFAELARNVADAPPQRPKPQTQDQLLGLFSSDVTGRDFVMTPATEADMTGQQVVHKPSLEVVYDEV